MRAYHSMYLCHNCNIDFFKKLLKNARSGNSETEIAISRVFFCKRALHYIHSTNIWRIRFQNVISANLKHRFAVPMPSLWINFWKRAHHGHFEELTDCILPLQVHSLWIDSYSVFGKELFNYVYIYNIYTHIHNVYVYVYIYSSFNSFWDVQGFLAKSQWISKPGLLNYQMRWLCKFSCVLTNPLKYWIIEDRDITKMKIIQIIIIIIIAPRTAALHWVWDAGTLRVM